MRRVQRVRTEHHHRIPKTHHTQALQEAQVPRMSEGYTVGGRRSQFGMQGDRSASTGTEMVQRRERAKTWGYTSNHFRKGRQVLSRDLHLRSKELYGHSIQFGFTARL